MNLKGDKAAIICDNFGYVGKIENIEEMLNPKFAIYESGSMTWRKPNHDKNYLKYKISGYAICREDNKVSIFQHKNIYMLNIMDIVEFYNPHQQNIIKQFIDNYKLYKDTIEYIIKKTDNRRVLYEPSVQPYNFNSLVTGHIPVEDWIGKHRNFEVGYCTQSRGVLYTVDAITFDSAFYYISEELKRHNMLPDNRIKLKETEIRFTESSTIPF